jgi:hypothetical protein
VIAPHHPGSPTQPESVRALWRDIVRVLRTTRPFEAETIIGQLSPEGHPHVIAGGIVIHRHADTGQLEAWTVENGKIRTGELLQGGIVWSGEVDPKDL